MGGDTGYREGEEQKGLGNSNHVENRVPVPKEEKKARDVCSKKNRLKIRNDNICCTRKDCRECKKIISLARAF